MYDVIVLGATFAAAGIAHTYQKNCLILEQGFQAGNEFYGALQFGSEYDKKPKHPQAVEFLEKFMGNSLYTRHTEIYPYLQEADVLFGTQVTLIQKTEKGFQCVIHGCQGFYTYEAKQIIDTRSNEKISTSKTFNLFVESDEAPSFPGVTAEKTGVEKHYILRLPMSLSCGYQEARAMVMDVVQQFSETQRLILSASTFDYQIGENYPKTQDGVLCLPSKAYKNPVMAFEAGLEVAL